MNGAYNFGLSLGKYIFAKKAGVSTEVFDYINYKADADLNDKSTQLGLAKFAANNLGNDEYSKNIYRAIYKNGGCITKYASNLFFKPVIKAIQGSNMEKHAFLNAITSSVSDTAKAILKNAPDLAYKSILVGGLGGAGLSALGWALYRDVAQKDADVDSKIEQAKLYKRIAEDLQKKVDAKKDKKNSTKKIVEAYGDADYVL